MTEWSEIGECDDCGVTYNIGDGVDHCGECGTCWDHCPEGHTLEGVFA